MRYLGSRRMRPKEVYNYFANRKTVDNSRKWDFARTDAYMMQLSFEYEGQILGPYNIFLPFTDDVGITNIIGKPFYNKPVVKDSVMQVTNGQIFLQFISTPCTFNRLYYMVLRMMIGKTLPFIMVAVIMFYEQFNERRTSFQQQDLH